MFSLIDDLISNPASFLEDALYRIPAILFALILHEWAHGYVAYRLGDPTARNLGRLSLNPLNHLDPIGTVCMLFLGFGWAKPVPINPRNFRNPRRDDLLVSIAGVTMNLILYIIFITGYYLLWKSFRYNPYDAFGQAVLRIVFTVASVNIALCIFNLLPIPPLDGSHVLNGLVLKGDLYASRQVAQVGMIVMLVLIATGWLGKAMGFLIDGVLDGSFWVLARIFGS